MDNRVKIYTKSGDLGFTSLKDGKRVRKDSGIISAKGSVDELNTVLGLARSFLNKKKYNDIDGIFGRIQNDLFVIGAYLSDKKTNLKNCSLRIIEMESTIDRFDSEMPVLKKFIIPGGDIESSYIHLARTVARRSERELIAVINNKNKNDLTVMKYMNRLSDLFFVIARYVNFKKKIKDVIWINK